MRPRLRGKVKQKKDGWEGWGGYMEAKKQKLHAQFSEDGSEKLTKNGSGSKIFSGISIYVNGYTKPSSDELKRLMMLHGGNYEHYHSKTKVTHVIATNLPDSKVRELKGEKVVRPEWITDSVKVGQLLSYTSYQLYSAKSGRQQGLSGYTVKQTSSESTSKVNCDDALNSGASNDLDLDPLESYANIDLEENTVMDDGLEMEPESSKVDVPSLTSLDKADKHEYYGLAANKISDSRTAQNVQTDKHSPAKAGDPRFINEYYNNSRLHHLSAWKAEFKDYVKHLQSQGTCFPGREKLRKIVQRRDSCSESDMAFSGGARSRRKRCVMHIDMDCFFVSVGLRNRPELKGKPVAVTHSKGKGATPAPGSDLNLERQQWQQKRQQAGKKRKQSALNQPSEELSFPDQSDSDSEDDIAGSLVTKETTETFHSMAEIASCSYEARKAGVKNGMYMGKAKQICPDLMTIPYDFEGYQTVSKALYDTVASYTHDIEAVSCDEMLVDCTDLLSDTGATPLEFTSLLRQEIYEKTDCTASAGLGMTQLSYFAASNILLAKMATRKAKPNGQFYLTEEEVSGFISTQSIQDIPGVGWSLTKRLADMKVTCCGDLQKMSIDVLQREVGPKTGQSLHRYCRGQDDRPIRSDHQRKSVSAEVNYGIRFTTENEAVRFLQELSEEVCTRLRNISMKGKTVTLKLMVRREDAPKETSKFMGHGICKNLSKSVSLPLATDDARLVGKECITILHQLRAVPEDLRGIGIQMQKLEPADLGSSSAAGKHQSILSFTVSKKQTDETQKKETPHLLSHTSNKPLKSSDSAESKFKSDQSVTSMTSVSANQFKVGIGTNDQSESLHVNVDQSESLHVNVDQSRSREAGDVLEDQEKSGESRRDDTAVDLVEELGRRQTASSQLPPLPSLPDIQTPESGRKRLFKDSAAAIDRVAKNEDDYFPSPSQVDPEVLKELPREIREQIEKEMSTRQLRKKPSTSTTETKAQPSEHKAPPSEQGCSHWDKRGDTIEPLPSPSQIDMSCLNALPVSMQREIKQAYEKQNRGKRRNMLNLQQVQSPTKSPNKRSPKKSPQFKVPKDRGAGPVRKKSKTKKLLFKDQTKATTTSSNHHTNDHTHGTAVDQILTESDNDNNMADSKQSDTGSETSSEDVGVNLCGAVEIIDVKNLIREWICSTPEPQDEDEEVLIDYLEKLILDKNLEQVDLVLKFMYRNIQNMNSTDWLLALKRIYTQTQGIVRTLYGGTLKSIPAL